MKKTLTFLLAIAMLAMVSITAFAATNDGSAATGIDVNGEFVAADAPADKISVEIKWDEMKFTYTEAQKVWNPTTHQYDQGDGTWSSEAKNITVSNHSNIGIKAAFTFKGNNGITGSFDNAELTLSTASGKALSDTPSATSKFSVTGGKLTESGKLGTIEVIISKSDVQGITTEAALKAAIANGGTIKLGSDITLSDKIEIDSQVEIDLCGYTIDCPQKSYSFNISSTTGNLIIKNGTLTLTGGNFTVAMFGNPAGRLEVINCVLKAQSDNAVSIINISGSNTTTIVRDCTFADLPSGTYGEKDIKSLSSNAKIILSGNIITNKGFDLANSGSMTVLAGTYNFDPTQYVDENTYSISQNGTTWTVTEK